MDIINITNEITKIVSEMDKIRAVIRERAVNSAQTLSDYRKQLAITIIKLKNGEELELEGNKVLKPTATQTNDIARGICWEYKLKADTADKLYKSAQVNLRILELKLMAEQSLLKRLDNR